MATYMEEINTQLGLKEAVPLQIRTEACGVQLHRGSFHTCCLHCTYANNFVLQGW